MKRPVEPKNMPKEVSSRSGCKVEWRTYATKEDADIAAEYARKLAQYQEDQGYDFGYQVPGAIEKVANGYEVVFP